MLDTLMKQGFAYHATESERLARQMEAAADEARGARAHWNEFLRISTHTIGEHLSDWPRAARLGELVLADQMPGVDTAKAWARLSVAKALAGDPAGAARYEIACLAASGDDFRAAVVEMRLMLVSALVGSKRAGEAAPIYAGALDLARRLGDGAPDKAVVNVSGVLATELLEAPRRTPDEATLMQVAADAAHEFALKDGDWRSDQTGLYLKSLVANVAGESGAALAHAEAALAIIAAHEPSPIDDTFLHLARAHAHHLKGDAAASARDLAYSDAVVATWDKPGLLSWYAEERARVFPGLPTRETDSPA